MISRANDIDFIITQTEEEALLLENNLIKKYQPPFNSLLKWDTGYVYIKIDKKTPFPLIKFTRYKDSDGSIYIGPKPWKKELKKLFQFLRQILKFRTCSNTQFKKWKVCSDYIFWLCKWWCLYSKGIYSENLRNINNHRQSFIINKNSGKENLENQFQTKTDKKEIIKKAEEEYNKIVNLIVDFFKWNTKPVEDLILWEINKAIKSQNFERAARLRDIYFNIQKFVEKQTAVLDKNINWYYFLVKKIWNYVAVVIVNFYNWKLIDIIKHKEKIDDENRKEKILKELQQEIGSFKILSQNWENEIYWTTNSIFENLNIQLKEFLQNQIESLIISSSFEKENLLNEILTNLQKILWLKNYPHRIETTDISHLSWWRTSGSIVTLIWGIPYKKWYRRYKIRKSEETFRRNSEENLNINFQNSNFIQKWDDYGALKQLLIRRFKLTDSNYKLEDLNLPDLFIIDGWKWQLWIVLQLSKEYPKMKQILEKVDFISIWKWQSRTRKWKISGAEEKIYKLEKQHIIKEINISKLPDEWYKILTKARDEAHRFANKYREKQMEIETKNLFS